MADIDNRRLDLSYASIKQMAPEWPDALITDYVRIQDVLRSIAEALTPTAWTSVDAPAGLSGVIRYRRDVNATVIQFQVSITGAASFDNSSIFTLPENLRPVDQSVVVSVATEAMSAATLTVQESGAVGLSATTGTANRGANFGHVMFVSAA